MNKKYGLLAAILLSIIIIVYSCLATPPLCIIEEPHYHDGELYYKDTVIVIDTFKVPVIDTFKRYEYKIPNKHKQFKDSIRKLKPCCIKTSNDVYKYEELTIK